MKYRPVLVDENTFKQLKKLASKLGLTLASTLRIVINALNIEEKEDIVRFVMDIKQERNTTIVLVEHDLGVVMDISDRIYVLDFGQVIGSGTPEEVASNPTVIEAYIGEE